MPRVPRSTEQHCRRAEAEGQEPRLDRSLPCCIYCHTLPTLTLIPAPLRCVVLLRNEKKTQVETERLMRVTAYH